MRTLFILLPAILVAACGGSSDEPVVSVADESASAIEAREINTEPSDSYEEAHSAALAAMQIAADKGHAWNTSDQLIEDAAKASANGDEEHAIALADEARIHATLAAAQADREAATWRDNVISE
jgi:hypothetical protein